MLLAALMMAPPAEAGTVAEVQGLDVRTWGVRFASGLALVVQQDRAHPIATIATVVGTGSSADPEGREGLAHLVEHAWFRSAEPGADPVADAVTAFGAEYQAFTGQDETTYLLTAPASALRQMLVGQRRLLLDPMAGVGSDALAAEVQIVENEVIERDLHEYEFLTRVLHKRIFPEGHAYSRYAGQAGRGMRESTLEELGTWTRTHYRPDNATLVLFGDVPDASAVLGMVREALGPEILGVGEPSALTIRPRDEAAPEVRKPASSGMRWRVADVEEPGLMIAWPFGAGRQADDSELLLAAGFVEQIVRYVVSTQDPPAVQGPESVDCTLDLRPRGSILQCYIALRWTRWPDEVAWNVAREVDQIVSLREGDFAREMVADAQAEGQAGLLALLEAQSAGRIPALHEAALGYHHAGVGASALERARRLAEADPGAVLGLVKVWATRDRAVAEAVVPREAGTGDGVVRFASFGGSDAPRAPQVPVWDGSLEPQAAPIDPRLWRRERLSTGLEVVVVPEGRFPTVHAQLVLRAGRVFAPAAGVDHLVWLLATPDGRGGAEDDRRAAMARWTMGRDVSGHVYGVTAPSANLDPALAALAEFVDHLHLDWSGWGDFRGLWRGRREGVDYAGAAGRLALQRALPGHPLAESPDRPSSLRWFDPMARDARRWWRAAYRPEGAVLYIVGPVNADTAIDAARSHFERWYVRDAPPVSAAAVAPPAVERSILFLTDPSADPATLVLACPAGGDRVGRALARATAWQMLWRSAREGSAWTYTPQVALLELPGGTSAFELMLTVRPDVTLPAARLLLDTVKRLADGQVDEPVLARARTSEIRGREAERRSGDGLLDAVRGAVEGDRPLVSVLGDGVDLGLAGVAEVRAAMAGCAGHESLVLAAPAAQAAAFAAEWPEITRVVP